ncbi:ABC-type branched-subunit amino acid transport system substrate-binding protein [Streptomyces sp. V4I2]|nr:ABC-type branched-subunit amino acid transport system substrate-binding protein [Streptomyces sp. V4I2]
MHEEPDLTDVPGELRALAGRCLAKDPAERPTAREVATALRDPRVSLARQISEGREEGSLPPAVLRMVAERSARALDVPTPQRSPRPTSGDAADDPAPSASQDAHPPTRRRVLLMGSAAASVVAVGGGVTAYLAGRGSNGGSDGALPVHTLGFQADLSGTNKADGVAQERGARLAVEQHNARAGITFRLALDTVDDRGEAARAKQAARRFTEAKVSAVLGPSTAVAALAAGPLYQDARTAMVLISVGDDSLLSANLRTLRVTRAPESFLAIPLTSYLTDVRPVDRTAVIDDRAAGRTGWELTNRLRLQPPDEGTTSVHPVAAGSDDFAPAVRAALAAKAQAVVFSGTSPERAARCARALADAGFTGPRLATCHIMRPTFLQQAGTAGQDWLFGTPFTDPGSVSRTFRTAYRARYGTAPGRWAPEAYDAVGLVTRALEKDRAERPTSRRGPWPSASSRAPTGDSPRPSASPTAPTLWSRAARCTSCSRRRGMSSASWDATTRSRQFKGDLNAARPGRNGLLGRPAVRGPAATHEHRSRPCSDSVLVAWAAVAWRRDRRGAVREGGGSRSPTKPAPGSPSLVACGLGVLSESGALAGEGHAMCELEEGVVHVVAYFPADP